MLAKVPDYILRQALRPWGRKFPKRPPCVPWSRTTVMPYRHWDVVKKDWVEDERPVGVLYGAHGEIIKKCTRCFNPIFGGGVFHPNEQYHYQCEPEYQPRRMRDARIRHANQTSYMDEVPDGNLDDSEYRFWVGSIEKDSGFSSCRACHRYVYTKHERIVHKAQEEEPCTVRLVDAYEKLKAKNKCIVCEEQTFSRRWGVPLCQTSKCVKRFMFDTTYWWQLEVALIEDDPERPKIVDLEGGAE